jgi:hypothetical protein
MDIWRRALIQPFLDAASAELGLLCDIMDSLASIIPGAWLTSWPSLRPSGLAAHRQPCGVRAQSL